jgi:hypothetical protein
VTTEHRKAPRRLVEYIDRVGEWGKIRYLHHLECGHIESRPRASSAPKLGCVKCLRVDTEENDDTLLKVNVQVVDFAAQMAEDEVTTSRLASKLAQTLGVPNEAIGLHQEIQENGRSNVQYAVVYLSRDDIFRIVGGNVTDT